MSSTLFLPTMDDLTLRAGLRLSASKLLRRGMEAGLLVMVCLSPWAFGSAGPEFECLLYFGVAMLLLAWGARMLLEGKLAWQKCPVVVCLAALTLYAAWQQLPLSHDLLRWLSPATARMYEQLLPTRAEILPFGETREEPVYPAGSTLSVYPGGTRQELFRLLAVVLLFAVVRDNLVSTGSLRRLSLVLLVNGVCLSLLALVQFFTASANTVYWTWPTAGTIFGPFVNRNHFAFYLNLCIGLAFGLLLRSKYFASDRAQERPDRMSSSLLEDPAALWTVAGLVLMISSVAFCASRGGVVALVCGWIGFLLIQLLHSIRFRRIGALLLILSLALALVSWFGLGRVQHRLATLWGKEVFRESRLELWSRIFPLIKNFPVWGTGYGTFPFLEPLCRVDPGDDIVCSHAENDYLEALLEGGLVRLVLSVVAIGLVFRLGYRAVRQGDGQDARSLAMGALFGFTTLVVQSFVDFGLHIPAIALVATVLGAHLCAAGSTRGTVPQAAASSAYTLRLYGLAPVVGFILAVLFGLLLSYEGWRGYKIEALELAASHAGPVGARAGDRATMDRRKHRIDCLAKAARLAPDSARLQLELALAHYGVFREERDRLRTRDEFAQAAQTVCAMAPVWCPMVPARMALTATLTWASTAEAQEELSKKEEKELVHQHLVPALRHFLHARDLCPLLPEPQQGLADNTEELERSDARIAYLERTRFLLPHRPVQWYLCGDALLDQQTDQTWKNWRRCLQLSDRYLSPILEESTRRLAPREILDRVLPDDPKILLAAALELYPEPTPERQPFLDRALALVENQPTATRPENLHLKALIQSALGRAEEAVATYQAALALEPNQVGWRFELARLLYQCQHIQESRRELLIVLSHQPQHVDARELLTTVERQIAEGK